MTPRKTVTVASKPHHVKALRSTWRKSREHAKQQVLRFARLFVLSAIPAVTSLIASGSHFDRKTLLALLVPIGETAYRQVFPALGAKSADSAPGMTIVPAQVVPAPVVVDGLAPLPGLPAAEDGPQD